MSPSSAEVPPSLELPTVRSRWDTQFKRGVLVLALILSVFLLWLARPIVPLLILAFIFSYILSPAVSFLCRDRLPRGLVTFLFYLLLLGAAVLGGYAMGPLLTQQYETVLNIASNLVTSLLGGAGQIPASILILDFPVDLTPVQHLLAPWVNGTSVDFIPMLQETLARLDADTSTPADFFRGTLDFGLGVLNTGVALLLSFLFVFVVSIYLTKDGPRIRAFFLDNFPSQYQAEWVSLIQCVGNVWHAFLWGQLLLSLTIGLMTYVVLTILGVQGALIFALIAGALEIIPNLGPIIAMVPPLLVGLSTGSTTFVEMSHFTFALVIALSYFVVQQLENTIIVPRVLGHLVRIHPILIIAGVTVGYLSTGIIGAFLAPPLLGTARVLGTYVFAKLMDYPVGFPRTRSRLPLREYDINIVIQKEVTVNPADPDGGVEATSAAKPEVPALPPAESVLDSTVGN